MIYTLISRDFTVYGGRIQRSWFLVGNESVQDVGPILLKNVLKKGMIASDGCGVLKSTLITNYFNVLYGNHKKKKWVKASNMRIGKDYYGSDEIAEHSFKNWRKWIGFKNGVPTETLPKWLKMFLIESDFRRSQSNNTAYDVIYRIFDLLRKQNKKKK